MFKKYIKTSFFTFALIMAFSALKAEELSEVQSLNLKGSQAPVLALSNGLTLYTFDPDQGQENPVCESTCAEKWPPVIVSAEALSRIPGITFGNISRSNGLSQLTANGMPVYTFFQDRLGGDLLGDGLGGVWHAVRIQNSASY